MITLDLFESEPKKNKQLVKENQQQGIAEAQAEPEQQQIDANRRAALSRERETAGSEKIDAQLAQQHAQRQEYEKTGKFWLKQKDTQQHISDSFVGKASANAAALELLKQQPELRGNLLITAYGPGESQGVAEGEVTKTSTGIVHKATDKYGAGEEPFNPRNPGKYARELDHVSKQQVKDLDASMGITWKNRGTKGVEVDEGAAKGSKDSAPKMGKQERKLAQGALKGARDMSAALGLVRDKDGVLRIPKDKKQGMSEGEKIGNMDADEFDDAMARLKKLAGAGPMKTVWDPEKRVYRNVPAAVQPPQTKK